MSVRNAIDELREAVFTRSSYEGKWGRENQPVEDLPHIVVVPSSPDPNGVLRSGVVVTWQLEVVGYWAEDDFDTYDYQRDPSNIDSFASVVLKTRMPSGAWQPQSMDGGLVQLDEDDEGDFKLGWEWRITGDLIVGRGGDLNPASLPADATPPTLAENLENVWGIAVANNILYVSRGSSDNAAEARIESYDLSDNSKRAAGTDITAGISAQDHHRGLAANSTHLFLVQDNGGFGFWYLKKYDLATRQQVTQTYLGSGSFRGCSVVTINGVEYVESIQSIGAKSRLYYHRTSDLTSDAALQDDLDYEVSGFVQVGEYTFDLIGSSLLCWDLTRRRPEFDLDLPSFRMNWYDVTRRGDYLWVSGKRHLGNGEAEGIIHAVKLPDGVI